MFMWQYIVNYIHLIDAFGVMLVEEMHQTIFREVFDYVFFFASFIFEPQYVVILFAAMFVYAHYLHKDRYIFTLSLAVVISGLISFLSKLLVMRGRPIVTDSQLVHLLYGDNYELSPSFPSGHALVATVVCLLSAGLYVHYTQTHAHKNAFIHKYIVWSVAIFIAFLVGMSRVYIGVHWLTDVLAGWGIGCIIAIVTLHWLFPLLCKKFKV